MKRRTMKLEQKNGKLQTGLQERKVKVFSIYGSGFVLSALMFWMCSMTSYAAGGEDGAAIVNAGFSVIFTIIAAIVSSIGSLLLLWGIFEWAQSLNTQDGGAQSVAFKRIASGLVATIGPQLIPIITASVTTA